MRRFRFSIGGIMTVVLVLAIGFAALKGANGIWAGVMLVLTYGMLGLAIVGTVCRRDAERVWWVGFAVFEAGYLYLATGRFSRRMFSLFPLVYLPTVALTDWLSAKMGMALEPAPGPGSDTIRVAFTQITNGLWALLAGILGGVLSRAFFAATTARPARSEPPAREADRTPRKPWLRSVIIALADLVLFLIVVAIWSTPDTGLWAGGMYLLTCTLLGIAILGAFFSRGRSREICLGVTLFGAGYLYIALIHTSMTYFERPRPYLVTDQFLNALRRRIPRGFSGVASDTRVLQALEQPIPMPFPDEITLRELVRYIQMATSTPNGPELSIYVDPLGLQEAERSLSSTVQIDLEGVPLRATLRLCLKQLGLMYYVEDGCLHITSEESVDTKSDDDDPFQIVGHCLLAWTAAMIGGVAAPLIAAAHRERPGRTAAEDVPSPASSH